MKHVREEGLPASIERYYRIQSSTISFFFAVGDCGSLSDPTNGQVNFTATTEGSVATYTCGTGYDPVGDTTRTCQSDEQWSGSEPVCGRKFIIYSIPAIEVHNNYINTA